MQKYKLVRKFDSGRKFVSFRDFEDDRDAIMTCKILADTFNRSNNPDSSVLKIYLGDNCIKMYGITPDRYRYHYLREITDRIPFSFVDGEFDGICYQVNGLIYRWITGETLGVCAGIRDENPLVRIEQNPPQLMR